MSTLQEHLETGVTTVARCWVVVRRDGTTYGFTDHDCALSFEGMEFKADAGMTASAIIAATGLSVDNSEALGALSDAAITEADIQAGRFDGAEVKAWLVNWADVDMRVLRFAGTIGELRRMGGAFHAELRGLTENLNQSQGRVYQTPCSAILGDETCQFDLEADGFFTEVVVETFEDDRRFKFEDMIGFEPAWFERGRIRVLSGAAEGLVGVIKRDRFVGTVREIEIWEAFRALIEVGDVVRLEAGCDKRAATCRAKFDNLLNFQGFIDIPGDDWLVSTPASSGQNGGGSLRRDDLV
ncbi:DUF2163 domain-containing protein [Octadecabacter sp. 1_MG-2023]|uniref:DUF2163 domain-containing protein n=1 Tax=unclassified Octadecabacter TaxID=196158 RepID=UPI001C097515|nr:MULTISPECIES: DUF2163 domain-containing protein [unclassified Octadecabacter]MBU2993697.1 DUF2163 domain-containing protein [Octadecabacter sp. B2R22]MDO6735459.1 DUF2163 domain-containing protein [Octadecabacter sp. 1_MG-2023]